jgi:hypothetical protein
VFAEKMDLEITSADLVKALAPPSCET